MKKFAVISFIVLVAGIFSFAVLNAENGKKVIKSGRIENPHITQKQLKYKIDFKMFIHTYLYYGTKWKFIV